MFGRRLSLVLALSLLATSCSKQKEEERQGGPIGGQTFAITASKLTNCRFKNPNPSYAFGSTIEPNPITCDEGVPRRAEKLSTAELPKGIKFVGSQLLLNGTANERLTNAQYEFYLENEAGYQIVKIQISIQ